MQGLFNLLATAPDGFGEIIESWDKLIYNYVLPIMFIVMGAVMVVVGIWRGSKIALADNEDSKKKAVKSLIWWLVGIALIFIVSAVTSILFAELGGLFAVPTGR